MKSHFLSGTSRFHNWKEPRRNLDAHPDRRTHMHVHTQTPRSKNTKQNVMCLSGGLQSTDETWEWAQTFNWRNYQNFLERGPSELTLRVARQTYNYCSYFLFWKIECWLRVRHCVWHFVHNSCSPQLARVWALLFSFDRGTNRSEKIKQFVLSHTVCMWRVGLGSGSGTGRKACFFVLKPQAVILSFCPLISSSGGLAGWAL